ncbi:MAG: hypothetical protein QOC55_1175 [Thermoleophilaceae bacterium]|jgi:hypothetical protein|nr:hypothetical protein [Thermoleophilaceae bacterium]
MLPLETKRAMLVGLENETIVTGAYTHDGGICPMLAAHRRGGRTDRESFAQCWDRYTGADKGRAATEREIRTLRTMLEASMLEPYDLFELSRPKRQPKPEPRPVREGWAWSRLFRRWDVYAATIGPLEDAVAPDRSREETPVVVADLAGEHSVRPVSPV